MTVARFRQAPLRAIYIAEWKGRWYAYVAGYRPAASDTPHSSRGYATPAEAMEAAKRLQHLNGLPIARDFQRHQGGAA